MTCIEYHQLCEQHVYKHLHIRMYGIAVIGTPQISADFHFSQPVYNK